MKVQNDHQVPVISISDRMAFLTVKGLYKTSGTYRKVLNHLEEIRLRLTMCLQSNKLGIQGTISHQKDCTPDKAFQVAETYQELSNFY